MPAKPLEAAAAMLPRAEVARAIAVAACKACAALESSSAELEDWYLDGVAAGAAAPSSGAGVPEAAAADCERAGGGGALASADGPRRGGGGGSGRAGPWARERAETTEVCPVPVEL